MRAVEVVGGKAARLVVELHADAGQHRLLDVAAEQARLLGGGFRLEHEERLALAGARQAVDQEAVDRGTDAEREQVGAAELRAYQVEGFFLDRDVAIGDDNEGARAAQIAGHGQRAAQRWQQLGAAAAGLAVDEADRAGDVLLGGGQRLRMQQRVATSERNDVEGVARAQPANQIAQQRLGGVQRKAVHRARHVDDEHVLARHHVGAGHPRRRLRHQQEEVLVVRPGAALHQHAGADCRAGEPVVDDDIAVGMCAAGVQHEPRLIRSDARHGDRMRGRADAGNRQRRDHARLQRKGVFRRHAGAGERLGDPRVALVALGRCRGRPLAAGTAVSAAVVARPDDRRKHESVGALGRHEGLGIAQVDRNLVARHHVGDRHREYVGPLLFEQRRALALALGLREFGARLLLLADLRIDDPVADTQPQCVDRGARRGWEHIARLDRRLALVAVHLRDHNIGDDAADGHVGAGALQRQRLVSGGTVDHEVRR